MQTVPRPKLEEPTTQIAVRFSRHLLEAIDRKVARLRAAAPGVDFTRVDAIKALVTLGSETDEAKGSEATKPKKRS